MLDLQRLPRTNRKPVIHLREITVGRDVQTPGRELVLPPGTHHVELQFDAVELSSPEKIRLQYRLDRVDHEWLDTGPTGRAVYSNIPAGTHAFHMRACNRDGIWDRDGTVYSITQESYFYETGLFQLGTATAGCLLLIGFLPPASPPSGCPAECTPGRALQREDAHRSRAARHAVAEFSGVDAPVPSGSRRTPGPAGRSSKTLENALDEAARAITEGRDAVQGLRSSTGRNERPCPGDLLSGKGACER